MLPVLSVLALLTAQAPASAFVTGPGQRVVENLQFSEGPVWVPWLGLIFSDIPANAIYREDGSVFLKPSGNSNGLAIDRQQRLVACEHGNRRLSRIDKDGATLTLAATYLGRKLNSPNDLTIRSDGTIFFTDPPYGVDEAARELPFSGVYALKPDKSVVLLSVYFARPNGIALSPDEKTLYVSDSQDSFIQAFDILESGRLANSRLFTRCENPDGIKVDAKGNLWAATAAGVMIFDPSGNTLETIPIPEHPSNLAFGGQDGKTLYVTARTGVYKVPLK